MEYLVLLGLNLSSDVSSTYLRLCPVQSENSEVQNATNIDLREILEEARTRYAKVRQTELRRDMEKFEETLGSWGISIE
ncbi:hypothetical protein NPIL_677761 [Nephila pilipes]|uniref:Uncharacterized protein n=1 Tax=Nephila pilipes TaxID=299642 RepID=A0A8X6PKL1_NEPPI|nr:hypothetical protein NPIL_677761 [Nephila pilipes]